MRNGRYSEVGGGPPRGGLDQVSRAAIKELGHIAVDSCTAVLKKEAALSLELGEAALQTEAEWVGNGPQLVAQARLEGPIVGRVVFAIPLRLLQRNDAVYADLLASADRAGSGPGSVDDLGDLTGALVGGLLDAIVYSITGVCGDDFKWSTGQGGVVLGAEELGLLNTAVTATSPVWVNGENQSYSVTLAFDEAFAAGLARLVLEADGRHEVQEETPLRAVASGDRLTYRRAYFQELGESAPEETHNHLGLLMDVPLEVTVELGRTRRQVREVLELGPGSVVELDKLAGEPVDIQINGRLIARGEVVVVEDNFGVRITDIVSPSDRLGPLG